MGQELARDKHQPDIVPTRKTHDRSIDRSEKLADSVARWLRSPFRRVEIADEKWTKERADIALAASHRFRERATHRDVSGGDRGEE